MRLYLDDSGSNDYAVTSTIAVAGTILPLRCWDALAEAWQPFDDEIKARDPENQRGGFHATKLVFSLLFTQEEKSAYLHELVSLLLGGQSRPIIVCASESAFPYGYLKRQDAASAKKRPGQRRPSRVRGAQRSSRVHGYEDPYYVALQKSWALAAEQELPANEKLHVVVALRGEHGHKSGEGKTPELYQRFYRRHADKFFSGITTDVGPDLCAPLKAADCIAYILGWCFRSRAPGRNDEAKDALLRPLVKRLLEADPVVEFMGIRVGVSSVRAAFDDGT